MATDNKNASLELTEQESESTDERTMYLEHGRTLAVASAGTSQIIEVRASSGQVELRVRMTEDGPVLQLDGVKLEVNSDSSIAMQCESFSVQARSSVDIASEGQMQMRSEGEMKVESVAEVRVRGEKIWLN